MPLILKSIRNLINFYKTRDEPFLNNIHAEQNHSNSFIEFENVVEEKEENR